MTLFQVFSHFLSTVGAFHAVLSCRDRILHLQVVLPLSRNGDADALSDEIALVCMIASLTFQDVWNVYGEADPEAPRGVLWGGCVGGVLGVAWWWSQERY